MPLNIQYWKEQSDFFAMDEIIDHPEATYNTDDCPHLWSAWELDKGLRDFSREYAKRKIPECPSAPYISNEGDL